MNKQWNYVEKDGNPKVPGIYWCTLIANEWKDGKRTERRVAYVETRYFADLDKEPDAKSWAMEGEPETGLAWIEECGSYEGEKVHAWMTLEDVGIAELPDGVERLSDTV
ncbi:MAG: hypothetical protein Q4C77_04185 [Eubacteriales bacterium]|nr:hypothetical protein [Eubacteriales bacterium]